MNRWRRLILFAVAIAAFTWLATGFARRTAIGVDADSANARIHQRFELPPGASDVNYTSTVWSSRVDFAIGRDQFVQWTQSKNWMVSEVDKDSFHSFIHATGGEGPKLITSGLVFDAKNGDVGFHGVYDEELKRASVEYSSR